VVRDWVEEVGGVGCREVDWERGVRVLGLGSGMDGGLWMLYLGMEIC
jgi:hypothetical protein